MLERLGTELAALDDARPPPGRYAAYLELHIEQGRLLEEAGVPIGIVEGIAAPTRFWLRLTGRADHSGAMPMALRADALTGAAEVILAVERQARKMPGVVGTVGVARLEPVVMNVIPEWVELGIDIRASSAAAKRRVLAWVESDISAIATARGLSATLETIADEEPVVLDSDMARLLEECCHRRGYPALRMPSGAGHDAMHLAALCPTGIGLVPSRQGVSRAATEWTNLDELTRAPR